MCIILAGFFFLLYLSSSKKSLKHSGPNRDLNSDLCDDGVIFYRLSFQANWELVKVSLETKFALYSVDSTVNAFSIQGLVHWGLF